MKYSRILAVATPMALISAGSASANIPNPIPAATTVAPTPDNTLVYIGMPSAVIVNLRKEGISATFSIYPPRLSRGLVNEVSVSSTDGKVESTCTLNTSDQGKQTAERITENSDALPTVKIQEVATGLLQDLGSALAGNMTPPNGHTVRDILPVPAVTIAVLRAAAKKCVTATALPESETPTTEQTPTLAVPRERSQNGRNGPTGILTRKPGGPAVGG